jgi:hypothetical protein
LDIPDLPLGANDLLSNMFSNILNPHFSLTVTNQVPHPYKTGKIIVLYILNFLDF